MAALRKLLQLGPLRLVHQQHPRLLTTTCLTAAPRVQHPAPAFKCQAVVDNAFKEISLSDYKGRYLVLYFYPLDFTFVCPTEIM